MDFIRRGFSSVRKLVGTVISSFYLFILYVLTLWLVVGTLSAIQVRDIYSDIKLPFTFGADDSGQAEEYLSIAKNRILDNLKYGTVSDQEIAMFGMIERVVMNFPDSPDFTQAISPEAVFNSNEFRLMEQSCDVDEQALGCANIQKARQAFTEFEQLKARGEIPTQAESEAKALSDLESKRQLTEFVELNAFFETMHYSIFLKAPREVLVMILTMVMGVLGSVITMTWSFVRQDTGYSLRRMLLLPFVGGMSAFIILVFLKAGQLTLAAGESSDQLSPFVLSFVGIVSGLLSERAYARMSDVGSTFFAVNEDIPRWGIRLEQALETAGVQYQDIAQYLQADAVKTKDIIEGRAPATLAQQQLIAACLRSDPREIFTDQAPRKTSTEKPAS